MNKYELSLELRRKKSFLCVGLDSDPAKLPHVLRYDKDPVFTFNKAIIDATEPYSVAYKPNLAFYEAMGTRGWDSLGKTVDYIRSVNPNLFIIADAKRGDIGNTAKQYAKTFFVDFDFDAVTLSPYMGKDSIEPFLAHQGKWAILLALTSNPGSSDLQMKTLAGGKSVFEDLTRDMVHWGNSDNIMFVVGATQTDYLKVMRNAAPDNFFLVPGVGAQGGDLQAVMEHASNSVGGLLINSSRGILFASSDSDFAEKAGEAAFVLQGQMSSRFLS